MPGTICCVALHLQRIAFVAFAAASAGAGAGAGAVTVVRERGAAGACRRRYCSLNRTVPSHWQAFLPVLLVPDGVLSALRLVLGLTMKVEGGGAGARGRTGTAGGRIDVVAALQKSRTATAAATCCCASLPFAVCSARSTCTS